MGDGMEERRDSARGRRDIDVTLKQYIEAILGERANNVELAEREREKAAAALRAELARSIEEGDRNLRDHIAAQVRQLCEMQEASARLEAERHASFDKRLVALKQDTHERVAMIREMYDDRLITMAREREARIAGVQREINIASEASNQAISKAEAATERRFDSVNEFRGQLTDTIARFLPREVADAQIAELRKQVETVVETQNKMIGSRAGANAATGAMVAVATLVLGIIVVAVNIIAGG